MHTKPLRKFSNLENAIAILHGMEDCSDEFVEAFVELHQQPIDNYYKYEWLLRSIIDVIKVNPTVLYVACGTAGYSRLFKNIKRFVGLDFSKKMIEAAKKMHQNATIDFEFNCTTFENYHSAELFDIIYLGPYGHNVPYNSAVLEKAKKSLTPEGMIFCTIPAPPFKGCWHRGKALLKHFLLHGSFEYDPIKQLKKMLNHFQLEIFVTIHMKTSIGYAYCYVVKSSLT